jgi:hypothetical protein
MSKRKALAAEKREDGRPAYALGPALAAWRKEHGMSAEALATSWGISVVEYRAIESRRVPSPSPAGVSYRGLVALMVRVEGRAGVVSAPTADRLHALHTLHDEDRRVHGTLPTSTFLQMARAIVVDGGGER